MNINQALWLPKQISQDFCNNEKEKKSYKMKEKKKKKKKKRVRSDFH